MKTKKNTTSPTPTSDKRHQSARLEKKPDRVVKNTTVAIDPSSTLIGLACFENNNLIDCQVKPISTKLSIRERLLQLEDIISRYFKEKQPTNVAIEKSNFSHQTQNGLLILSHYKILAVARRHHVPVYEYAPITIRKVVCGHGHAKKQDVMKIIVSKYPELRVFASSERRWVKNYHFNMFDAIAVGLTFLSRNHQ